MSTRGLAELLRLTPGSITVTAGIEAYVVEMLRHDRSGNEVDIDFEQLDSSYIAEFLSMVASLQLGPDLERVCRVFRARAFFAAYLPETPYRVHEVGTTLN